MNISIVQFDNGKYGIEKSTIFGIKEYLSFCSSSGYWWSIGDRFFEDCQSEDLEKIKEILSKRWAKPVKTIQTV